MLEQTKRAYSRMKKAGFKRGDFRARVERHYIGRNEETGAVMYEYGDCNITVFNTVHLYDYNTLKALHEAGMGLQVWIGEKVANITLNNHSGKIMVWNSHKKDDYDMPEYKAMSFDDAIALLAQHLELANMPV